MRSRTAETIYAENPFHKAKSAGVTKGAKVKVTSELLHWADMIFVMEDEHEEYLREEFWNEIRYREVINLDICDNYYFMDPELIELIKTNVSPYLER
jgi:predicted protein tyrosine phosphatase